MVNWRFWGWWRSAPPAPPPPVSVVLTTGDSERVLWSMLTDEQRATYPHGFFDVTGSLGGRYRIHTHSAVQNITQQRPGGVTEYCMGLSGAIYRWDVWLAQKVIIESDEPLFLRTAVPYIGGARQRPYTPQYYW